MLTMNQTKGPTWDFSDAWFLTAVGINGRRPKSLDRVIATADALNHSILTHAEVQQAVRRLNGGGLLQVEPDGRFAVTAQGRDLVAKRRGSFFEQTGSVLRLLEDLPISETDWSIEPSAVQTAFETYRRRTGY